MGSVAVLAAVVTLVGVLRILSSVHGSTIEVATLRRADTILAVAVRLGWLALGLLCVTWALRVHWDPGDSPSRTALNAVAIAVPFAAVVIVATLARRVPARLAPH